MYVQEQPKHSIISILIMDPNGMLSEENHQALDKLGKFSDIIFIFLGEGSINQRKFTSLYHGIAWTSIGDEGENLAVTQFKVLQYCKEVFNTHQVYLLGKVLDQKEVDINEEQIQLISMSTIIKPIYKAHRLTAEETRNIYWKNSDTTNNDKPSKIKLFWSALINRKGNDNFCNMYYTWNTSSSLIFLRSNTIELFLKIIKEDYLQTFSGDNFSSSIVSGLKKLGIDNLDSDLKNIDYGNLSTEGGKQ